MATGPRSPVGWGSSTQVFGLGDTEFLLIIIFAFLLFGPDKLPSMGRTIGRGIKQFRQASDSVTKVVKTEVLDPLTTAAQAEAGETHASQGLDVPKEPPKERSIETFAERRARLAKERETRVASVSETPVETATKEASRTPDPAAPAFEKDAEPRESVASIWGLSESSNAPEPVATPKPANVPGKSQRSSATIGEEDATAAKASRL